MLPSAVILQSKFALGASFTDFVETGRADGHHAQWHERYGALELDARQRELVAGFTRRMNILCLTGIWCGDCALQGAALARIADARPDLITLRFLPRAEEHADLLVANRINGGFRVPLTWFCAEDFEPVHRVGDRTLSRYRSMARKALGQSANVLAPPPADPVREVLREMLGEVERVHLLLRLSTRLRQRHGD